MAFIFWQYMRNKVAVKVARLPKEFKFGLCTRQQLQVWFLGVLHRELIYCDRRYNHPRLSKLKDEDDYLSVLHIKVVNNFAITLEDGSHNFSLVIIGTMRAVKDQSISRPTNLAEEDFNLRDWRLEKEKEERNSRQVVLK